MRASVVFLILACFGPGGEFARAEAPQIQMFVNYRGKNQYDSKIVSTPAMPTSAFYVYVGDDDQPTTAACYLGAPGDALKLFHEMVRIFNAEYHRDLKVRGAVVADPETGAPSLRIDAFEKGVDYNWFEHMGVCWRNANKEELHPTK